MTRDEFIKEHLLAAISIDKENCETLPALTVLANACTALDALIAAAVLQATTDLQRQLGEALAEITRLRTAPMKRGPYK